MGNVLEVRGLEVSFRKEGTYVPTVCGVSFAVEAGEMLGIVGESGCGKSVTSLAVMGLLPKGASRLGQSSVVRFGGKSLSGLSEEEYRQLRGKEMAMIFQDPMTSLNPVLTVGYQLVELIREHEAVSKKDAAARAINMLHKVGIPRVEQVMREYPHQLSGGMRQRVMIAMAMLLEPKLLIADEPTTALDVTVQAQILDLMKTMQRESNAAVVLITHDLGVVAEVCDRVVVMYAGVAVEEATVDALFEQPKHPYTQGLLGAMPTLLGERNRLQAIPGTVPLPDDMPKGCRFAPRCDKALPHCFEQEPPTVQIAEEHAAACWLYAEGGVEGYE
ncbi:ABC transporter ATP-binding protein [Paenibacillus turpanensis]|uniref:ABC transporter ATP-binding protein n=1 Tax=Paenibacillus turpanensis TaxID=2689078 RepID=UPI00140E530B|nr:ABC transporter ATP-binding protein [Paenibacillus turpanensis]